MHYGGFDAIFDSPQLTIGTLHHNGIVERSGKARLGEEITSGGRKYLVDLVATQKALKGLFRDDTKVGQLRHPNLLRKALASGRVGDIRMLSSRDQFLDGYSSGGLVINVLGPVPEKVNGVVPAPSRGLRGH